MAYNLLKTLGFRPPSLFRPIELNGWLESKDVKRKHPEGTKPLYFPQKQQHHTMKDILYHFNMAPDDRDWKRVEKPKEAMQKAMIALAQQQTEAERVQNAGGIMITKEQIFPVDVSTGSPQSQEDELMQKIDRLRKFQERVNKMNISKEEKDKLFKSLYDDVSNLAMVVPTIKDPDTGKEVDSVEFLLKYMDVKGRAPDTIYSNQGQTVQVSRDDLYNQKVAELMKTQRNIKTGGKQSVNELKQQYEMMEDEKENKQPLKLDKKTIGKTANDVIRNQILEREQKALEREQKAVVKNLLGEFGDYLDKMNLNKIDKSKTIKQEEEPTKKRKKVKIDIEANNNNNTDNNVMKEQKADEFRKRKEDERMKKLLKEAVKTLKQEFKNKKNTNKQPDLSRVNPKRGSDNDMDVLEVPMNEEESELMTRALRKNKELEEADKPAEQDEFKEYPDENKSKIFKLYKDDTYIRKKTPFSKIPIPTHISWDDTYNRFKVDNKVIKTEYFYPNFPNILALRTALNEAEKYLKTGKK